MKKEGLLNLSEWIDLMENTLTQSTQWGNLKTDLGGYVGIDTLQEQVRKKVLKKGFEFNILVVGRSGLGKSTLTNTLFKSIVSRKDCCDPKKIKESTKIPSTTQINSISHVIEEKGVRLRLTITDTPGFGDQINNEDCWVPVSEYIKEQYERYLFEERSMKRRKHIPDSRVHCCIYFIPPTGHTLQPLDIEFMRRLHTCVNIIPVIAKADTLTLDERTAFKTRIKEDLLNNSIKTYPVKEIEEDPDDALINHKIRDMVPFAIVGSNQQHQVNGRKAYGRRTSWGIVEVENKAHCEFSDLRDMLIRTHMKDLVDYTSSTHYENYRYDKLHSESMNNGTHYDMDKLNEIEIRKIPH
ncbi:Septin-9 [Nymphon striatum]|nr:Septin-9 [Nymphon striatum]